jgi:D-alanyl-D-alanine endopeptidase (penicillin-binding protein 7)
MLKFRVSLLSLALLLTVPVATPALAKTAAAATNQDLYSKKESQ